MAMLKIPHLVVLPGPRGGAPRRYWQPSSKLRALGWRAERLPDDEAAAIARARVLNEDLARWRRGEGDADRDGAGLPGRGHNGGPAMLETVRPETIAWLIRDYQASRFWRKLKPSTRRGYQQCLRIIEAWVGPRLIRAIDKPVIEAWYAKAQARTPAFANAVVRVLQILLGHAVRLGKLTHNPADRPGLVPVGFTGKLWPRDAIELVVEVADRLKCPSIGDAVLINEWLGQREGDLIALTRTIYRHGVIHWLQSKGGVYVQLPVDMVEHLAQRLEAARVRHERAGVTAVTLLVDEATGQPYTEDRFRRVFAAVRKAAARQHRDFEVDYLVAGRAPQAADAMTVHLDELQFMHLRHTAVTRLAEAGVPPDQVAAITGHSLKSVITIIERYRLRTAAMAREAFRKRIEHETRRG